jgi:hypothetical protein
MSAIMKNKCVIEIKIKKAKNNKKRVNKIKQMKAK